jgi:transposase-like protein
MKLHANAAWSLMQGRRMVLRVIDEGWSIRAAAAAAETSQRTYGKWVSQAGEGATVQPRRLIVQFLSRVLTRRGCYPRPVSN